MTPCSLKDEPSPEDTLTFVLTPETASTRRLARGTRLLVALFCLLSILAWPVGSLAQEAAPLTPVPPGDDKILPLRAGDPAPVSGQLFDTPTALRWGNYLEQCRVRLTSDVVFQRKVDQAQITYLSSVLDAERKQYLTVTGDYQKQVAQLQTELRNPPFYSTVWFGTVLGVVGTVAAVTATAYLVHSAQ